MPLALEQVRLSRHARWQLLAEALTAPVEEGRLLRREGAITNRAQVGSLHVVATYGSENCLGRRRPLDGRLRAAAPLVEGMTITALLAILGLAAQGKAAAALRLPFLGLLGVNRRLLVISQSVLIVVHGSTLFPAARIKQRRTELVEGLGIGRRRRVGAPAHGVEKAGEQGLSGTLLGPRRRRHGRHRRGRRLASSRCGWRGLLLDGRFRFESRLGSDRKRHGDGGTRCCAARRVAAPAAAHLMVPSPVCRRVLCGFFVVFC